MNDYRHLLFVGTIACAAALPALAQVEYRYQSADDPARQTAQQSQSAPQQPVQQSQQPAAPVAPAPPCTSCGTVDSIRVIEQAGEASGAGMIAGGVLGGVLGHQIGRGSGNTAATIVGAAGGAYAGHQIEKNLKKGTRFDISVRMDDGTLRSVSYDTDPGLKTGEKVKLVDGKLVRN